MENDWYCDAMVLLDDGKRGFFSHIKADHVSEILANGGLANTEQVILRESTDRPVPRELSEGLSCITDVYIQMEPNITLHLN